MSKWKLPPSTGHMDLPTGIYFQNMTYAEYEERLKKDDIILVPVGSTENHGPHAPLGEDTFLVTRMCELVAEKTGCTVAQPIWYGSHPYHHLGMPGTVMVDEDVLIATIRSVMAGFWNAGFRKQIFLNGHGQEWVIPTALHQFTKKYQVPGIYLNVNYWYSITPQRLMDKEHGGPFDTAFVHADECETSYSLALFPELIHMDKAVDTKARGYLPPRHIDKSGGVYRRPIFWYAQAMAGPLEVVATPQGVVGSATLAKAEKAIMGLEEILDYLVELHDDVLRRFPPGELPPWEEVSQLPKEEIDALVRGPLKGGRHIYTVTYPP
jgi:creatinine amidohydrolase/Fe(II)-dependent formamide hydrolase-like protein